MVIPVVRLFSAWAVLLCLAVGVAVSTGADVRAGIANLLIGSFVAAHYVSTLRFEPDVSSSQADLIRGTCPGCSSPGRYLSREHAVLCKSCGLTHL